MLALAQVMVTRAGLALREAEFTKPTVITGEKYHMTTPKVSPALTAYEKLERAWRRLLIDFERHFSTSWSKYKDDAPYEERIQNDYTLDPDLTFSLEKEKVSKVKPIGSQTDNPVGEGEAPAEPSTHPKPKGSAGASPSRDTDTVVPGSQPAQGNADDPRAGHGSAPTDPADQSPEGASHTSPGQRPGSNVTIQNESPVGALHDSTSKTSPARAP